MKSKSPPLEADLSRRLSLHGLAFGGAAAGLGVLASSASAAGPGGPSYPETAAEAAAGSVPMTFQYPPGNVLRYGVNTTPGKTEMTAAIQAALNQSGRTANGAAPAYLPSGSYLVSEPLKVSSNSRFYGDGASSIIHFLGSWSVDNILLSNVSNAVIENMKLVIIGSQSSGEDIGVVTLRGANWCHVRNLIITGVQNTGIIVEASLHCHIERNYLYSFSKSSNGDSSDIRVVSNTLANCSYNVIDSNQCFGGNENGIGCDTSSTPEGLLSKNVFTNNRIGTHTRYGICLYTHESGDTYDQIIGNYVEGINGSSVTGNESIGFSSTGAGIYVAGVGAVTVANNTVVNCCSEVTAEYTQGGITINSAPGASPCIVVGNAVYDMAQGNTSGIVIAGIRLINYGVGSLVANNLISQRLNSDCPGYTGILVQGGNGTGNVTVSGNQINIATSLANTCGITIFANANLINISITGNTVVGCSYAGIRFVANAGYMTSSFTVAGNTVQGGGENSIPLSLANVANGSVSSNTLIAGANANALNVSDATGLIVAGNFLQTRGNIVVRTNGNCSYSQISESNILSGNIHNGGTGIVTYTTGIQAPGAGTWAVGDHVRNVAPQVAAPPGWYCVAAGTPGIWKAEAPIAT